MITSHQSKPSPELASMRAVRASIQKLANLVLLIMIVVTAASLLLNKAGSVYWSGMRGCIFGLWVGAQISACIVKHSEILTTKGESANDND